MIIYREGRAVRAANSKAPAQDRAHCLPERAGDHQVEHAALRLQRRDVRDGGVQAALRVRLFVGKRDKTATKTTIPY